jgi:hypothetical protein
MQQSVRCACAPLERASFSHGRSDTASCFPDAGRVFADDIHKSQRTVSAAMGAADAFADRYAL